MIATLPASPELTDAELAAKLAHEEHRLHDDYNAADVSEARRVMREVIAELRRHRSSPSSAWRDIKDAPKDGTEFQAWVGHWESRCRFNPDTEAFEIWGRTDYDQDGWDIYWNLIPTHYMPAPEAPAEPPK